MENIDNVKTALDAGMQLASAEGRVIERDGIPIAITPNGMTVQVLKDAMAYADGRAANPRRREGTATHQELASFLAHVNRFKDAGSVVFADVEAVSLTAVLDYHPASVDGKHELPRWGKHRSVYSCPLSDQWKLWKEHDGKAFSQDDFADFIEQHMDDLAAPTGSGEDKDMPMPTEILTMARNLVIRSKGEFSRALNPTTGESSLVCKNENETTSTKIPRAFMLGIPVFVSGAMYRVEARLRMAMQGRPTFSYVLYQPGEILRDAFNEVREKVTAVTALPLFVGKPE